MIISRVKGFINNNQRGFYLGSLFISTGMLIARIAAFYRDILLLGSVNRQSSDTFYLALAIPDLLYFMLVGGLIGAAFMPYYIEKLIDSKDSAWRDTKVILNYFFIFILVVCCIFIFDPNLLIRLLVNDYTDSSLLLTRLILILMPTWFLIVVNGVLVCVLNAEKNFFIPSISLIFNNTSMIFFIVILKNHVGIYSFPIGIVLGTLIQSLILLFYMRKKEYDFKWNVSLKLSKPLKRVIISAMPLLISLGNYQYNFLIFQRFSYGNEGVISAVRFSDKIAQTIISLLVLSLVMAAYPYLIEKHRDNEMIGFNKIFNELLREILLRCLPICLVLCFFSEEVIQFIEILTGSQINVSQISKYLSYFSLIVLSFSITFLISRLYIIFNQKFLLVLFSLFSYVLAFLCNVYTSYNPFFIFIVVNIMYLIILLGGLIKFRGKIMIEKKTKILIGCMVLQIVIVSGLNVFFSTKHSMFIITCFFILLSTGANYYFNQKYGE